MTRNISLTLSQFISNESAFCAVLSFGLGDHHGGKWSDEAVPQGHVQGLSRVVFFLLLCTNVTGRKNRIRGDWLFINVI